MNTQRGPFLSHFGRANYRQRTEGVGIMSLVLAIFVAWGSLCGLCHAQQFTVTPTGETEAVPSDDFEEDFADDPAIWLHPTNPELSLIIGQSKAGPVIYDNPDVPFGGLFVYDLDGNQLHERTFGSVNGIDVRYNFPLGGEHVDIVAGTNKSNDTIFVYKIDPVDRQLKSIGGDSISIENPPDNDDGKPNPTGFCLYRSPITGRYYAFVVFAGGEYQGLVHQYELLESDNGGVQAIFVREFNVGDKIEGCVADDELGYFYVGEEEAAIWRYGAEPSAGTDRVKVDAVVGDNGHIEPDVEGLTIYHMSDGTGYLIASNQRSEIGDKLAHFTVYTREGNNDFITSFAITNAIDENGHVTIGGAYMTDGIDVLSSYLGARYAKGLFVAHHNNNESDGSKGSNFKLVPWDVIAAAADPDLEVDSSYKPCDSRAPSLGMLVCPSYAKDNPIGLLYYGVIDEEPSGDLKEIQLWAKKDQGEWEDTSLTQSEPAGSFEYETQSGDGIYYFHLVATDKADNASDAASGTGMGSTVFDTQSPDPGTASSPGTVTCVVDLGGGRPIFRFSPIEVTYSGAGDTGSGLKEVELWVRKGQDGWEDTQLRAFHPSGTFYYTGMTGSGTYYFATRAQDNAGNFSTLRVCDGDTSTEYTLTLRRFLYEPPPPWDKDVPIHIRPLSEGKP